MCRAIATDFTDLWVDNVTVKAAGKILALGDQTNEVSLPITAGSERAITVNYSDDASLMKVAVDGVASEVVAYDGTLGTGDITISETSRDINRTVLTNDTDIFYVTWDDATTRVTWDGEDVIWS